jgi:hypothetical protein
MLYLNLHQIPTRLMYFVSILERFQDVPQINKCKGMLEEARSIARLRLANILLQGIDDQTGTCVHKCGWSSKYAFAYLDLLETRSLWPKELSHKSISKAIETAGNMPTPKPQESSASCQYAYKHCVPEYRVNRRQYLEKLDRDAGLCLHCVRAGAENCEGPWGEDGTCATRVSPVTFSLS